MAKPVITDKPVIDQAEFNGVTIWRKEGGSIEVSDTNYPSMKAALQDIAAKAGIKLEEGWNTQYMGWYIIQQLKGRDSQSIETFPGKYSIIKNDNGSYTVVIDGQVCDNAKGAMRQIAEAIGFEYDSAWTTQQFGAKLSKAMGQGGAVSQEEDKIKYACVIKYTADEKIDFSDPFDVEVAEHTFSDGTGTIKLVDKPTRIKDSAFNSQPISSFEIPDSIIEIGDYVFGHTKIKHLILPESVSIVGYPAAMEELEEITVFNEKVVLSPYFVWLPKFAKRLRKFHGPFASVDERCLIFDEEVKLFASYGLTSYVFSGEGYHWIGSLVNELDLTEITISKKVSIFSGAFRKCNNLQCVNLESDFVCEGAFTSNPNLERFAGSSSFIRGDGKFLTSVSSGNCLCKHLSLGAVASKDMEFCEIPDSPLFEHIGESCFANSGIKKISLPNSVKSIGPFAFENCKNLEELYIPDSVTPENQKNFTSNKFEGLYYIFDGCDSLKTVSVPKGLTVNYDSDTFNGKIIYRD